MTRVDHTSVIVPRLGGLKAVGFGMQLLEIFALLVVALVKSVLAMVFTFFTLKSTVRRTLSNPSFLTGFRLRRGNDGKVSDKSFAFLGLLPWGLHNARRPQHNRCQRLLTITNILQGRDQLPVNREMFCTQVVVRRVKPARRKHEA